MYADFSFLLMIILLHSSSVITKYKNRGAYEKPEFIGSMKNVTAIQRKQARMTCSISSLGDYKVAWIRGRDSAVLAVGNDRIVGDDRFRVRQENLVTWHLVIDQVEIRDLDWYTCQVNTSPPIKQRAFIDVVAPPDIEDTGTPAAVSVEEGEDVTLICKASGRPQPTIVWRRADQKPIVISDKAVYTYTGETLQLNSVTRQASSEYLCVATNGWPPAVSKQITLNVNFAPEVISRISLIEADCGERFIIHCESRSRPIGSHYWLRRSPLDVRSDKIYLKSGRLPSHRISHLRSEYHVRFSLVVTKVGCDRTDNYICVSENRLGRNQQSITVIGRKNNSGSRFWTTKEYMPVSEMEKWYTGSSAQTKAGNQSSETNLNIWTTTMPSWRNAGTSFRFSAVSILYLYSVVVSDWMF